MNATRLYDCLSIHIENNAKHVMLAGKEGGQWKEYTVPDVYELVNQLSASLLRQGISPGDMTAEKRDKIAIITKNRVEWLILDLAVQQIGAILVPIYPTINVNELQFILNDAEVKLVFVSDEELYLKVLSTKINIPNLKEIYTFDHVPNAIYWKELLQPLQPSELKTITTYSEKISNSDVATIIYTSGTTGTPKGVMLSHGNILSNVIDCLPVFPPYDNMKSLSFLPLNHIFERMVSYLYLFKGVSIYYAESLDTIGVNLLEVKPDLFTTVPRLLEKIYDRIMEKGSELTGIKKKLFYWAHSLAEKFEINANQGAWYKFQLSLANKIVLSKWREGLGGNIKCIVTGGAACQVRLIRIFTAARMIIMEGYGLTETSPVIAVNRYQESGRKFGTVGPLINNVEVRIAEDGEILCKGPNIMLGYYKHPELTDEVIKDGWFYTGDIGVLDDKNFLKITDRKKELFKTSGGKYVAPLPVENKLKESPFIEQVMVVGAERKFVGAIIIPSFPNLREWIRKNGIEDSTNEELLKNPRIIELYKDLVQSFNKFFNHVEQIKKFELLATEWSVDTGELTPKLSMKRKVIAEKYKDAIERIYK